MDNFKSNSHKAREERPRAEKVVTGNVSVVKKKGFSKFMSSFMGEERSGDDIKSHILDDLVIPTIKDAIMDTVGILLGRGRYSGSRRDRPIADRVSYGKFYSDSGSRTTPARTSTVFNTDEVVFGNKGDAEFVLDRLYEMLEQYKVVRVTDFYDLAGVTADYTAQRYGWSSLHGSRVERVRDGYIVELPRAMALD